MTAKKQTRADIQHRHRKRRQQRIREQKIRRCIFFAVLIAITIFAVLFFTPVFNIRSVSVIGNERVSVEQILEKTGDMTGRFYVAYPKEGKLVYCYALGREYRKKELT